MVLGRVLPVGNVFIFFPLPQLTISAISSDLTENSIAQEIGVFFGENYGYLIGPTRG